MSTSLADQIIARHSALKSDASNFFTEYQDCADYIMPRRGGIITQRSPGSPQTVQLFDRTAGKANLICAAGLLSQLTPPGELWAKFAPEDEEASEEQRAWFDRATQVVFDELHRSNFYLALHEAFLDLGCFCTANVLLDAGTLGELLNYRHVPVGSYVIAVNNLGRIDTVLREWKWTARQAAQEFGEKALGPEMLKALRANDQASQNRPFTFLHAVYPRAKDEARDGPVEGSLRPIASIFVCVEDKTVMKEDGYYEMPEAVCRMFTSNGEAYGRGPGIDALPAIRLLNRKVYDLTLALEKGVNPSWLAPEDAAYRPDNRPNGVTYWDASNPANKPEQLESKARVDWVVQSIQEDRELIREEFFVDMFQMLNRPDVLKRERTAFQIAEMLQEKLLLFAPFFARITQEMLSPLLTRTFAIMAREGRLPDLPADIVDGVRFRIVYTSKIAAAIKAAQDNAIVDMLQLCSLMQPFDQSVSLVVNWRKAYRNAARNRGVSAEVIRSDDEVDEMVAQMQRAEAAMREAELAKKTSEAARNLGPEAQRVAANAVGQFK